jgi:hypothetical protein
MVWNIAVNKHQIADLLRGVTVSDNIARRVRLAVVFQLLTAKRRKIMSDLDRHFLAEIADLKKQLKVESEVTCDRFSTIADRLAKLEEK